MLARTNSTVFQSYHITNKRFQFLRVVSRWQQDSKLRLYDIQFKLLEFIYIASQQIKTTYLTCLNQSTASMTALFFLIEKPFLFLWEGFIASHSVWIHWSPRTTKTWLIILLSFSGTPHEFKGIKMLPSCQVRTIWCLIGWGFVTTMLITTRSLKFKISMVVWWTPTVHIMCSEKF